MTDQAPRRPSERLAAADRPLAGRAALDAYLAEIGDHPLFDPSTERSVSSELAEARGLWAGGLVRIPGLLGRLVPELEERLLRAGLGDLVDGVLARGAESTAGSGSADEPETRAVSALLAAWHRGGRDRSRAAPRHFATLRWRPEALKPWLAPFQQTVAELRDQERWLRQLCRFAGGIAQRRVDAVAPGDLDEAWLAGVRLAADVRAGLLAQFRPVRARQLAAAAALEMTPAEALALAADIDAARGRVETLRERMVRANLRLVVSVARAHAQRGVPLEDLIQDGNIGLLRAVDKFDASLGYRFSTYATWWIRQAVSRALAEQGRTIRVPGHVLAVVQKVRHATARFLASHGREPLPRELLAMGLDTPERVRAALDLVQQPLSLEMPLAADSEDTLAARVHDPDAQTLDDAAAAGAVQDAARTLLSGLDERAGMVLRLRFGIDSGREHTLAEVGSVLGLSGERVRQIEREALALLRETAPDLRSLLED